MLTSLFVQAIKSGIPIAAVNWCWSHLKKINDAFGAIILWNHSDLNEIKWLIVPWCDFQFICFIQCTLISIDKIAGNDRAQYFVNSFWIELFSWIENRSYVAVLMIRKTDELSAHQLSHSVVRCISSHAYKQNCIFTIQWHQIENHFWI